MSCELPLCTIDINNVYLLQCIKNKKKQCIKSNITHARTRHALAHAHDIHTHIYVCVKRLNHMKVEFNEQSGCCHFFSFAAIWTHLGHMVCIDMTSLMVFLNDFLLDKNLILIIIIYQQLNIKLICSHHTNYGPNS